MMSAPETLPSTRPAGPFDLDSDAAYRAWRSRKLAAAALSAGELLVPVADGLQLSATELDAMHGALARGNLVIYQLAGGRGADKVTIRQLGRQFGLEHLDDNLCADEDSITSLTVVEKRSEGEYIPYTNKRLNWHTDGYYNPLDRQIRAVILHCVQPAARGGESAFLDHEMAYIALRDQDPALIRALMAPDAMTIPANVQNGRQLRPEQGGPVFSVDPAGHLHMRYSARTRNVVWKDDAATRAAAEALVNLFHLDSPYILRHRLKSGQGVLTNNVLHCRTAFEDDAQQPRLLYRARYYDRIVDLRKQPDAVFE
jgi:alpha-ketoglutarate-dependent taurine dioxygenase